MPIMLCIEGKVSTKNLIMTPQNNFSYNSTLIIWLFFIVAMAINIKNYYDVEEDPNMRRLDVYPLYVTIFFLITRCFVVGTRYGSTPPKIINSIRIADASQEYYDDQLMARAWIKMSPEQASKEIQRAMAKNATQRQFFTFKTLTPLIPRMKAKLTNTLYWSTKGDWNFNAMKK